MLLRQRETDRERQTCKQTDKQCEHIASIVIVIEKKTKQQTNNPVTRLNHTGLVVYSLVKALTSVFPHVSKGIYDSIAFV